MRYIFLFILLFSLALFADAKVSKLQLSDALELIEESGAEIDILKLEEKFASLEVKKTDAHNFGSLDLIMKGVNSNDAGAVFGMKLHARDVVAADFLLNNLNEPQNSTYFDNAIRYTLPLFTGFKIQSAQSIMQSLQALKKLSTSEQYIALQYEIKNSFYTVALLEEQKSNFEMMLSKLDILNKTVLSYVEEGFLKPLDAQEIQNNIYTIKEQIEILDSNKIILLKYISFLIHRDIMSVDTKTLPKFTELESQENLKNSLILKKLNIAETISIKNTKLNRADYYPQLFFVGEVGSSDKNFLNNLSDNAYYSTAVVMQWNIFKGFETSYTMEQSEIDVLKAKSQKALVSRKLELEYQTLVQNYTSTQHRINIANKKLVLQKDIYKNYESQYFEKLLSMNRLLEQNIKIIRENMAVATLKKEIIEIYLKIEKLVSKGV